MDVGFNQQLVAFGAGISRCWVSSAVQILPRPGSIGPIRSSMRSAWVSWSQTHTWHSSFSIPLPLGKANTAKAPVLSGSRRAELRPPSPVILASFLLRLYQTTRALLASEWESMHRSNRLRGLRHGGGSPREIFQDKSPRNKRATLMPAARLGIVRRQPFGVPYGTAPGISVNPVRQIHDRHLNTPESLLWPYLRPANGIHRQ